MICTPKKLVLDTNVILDIFHFNNTHIVTLKERIYDKQFICFSSEACLNELKHTLNYPKFGLDAIGQNALYEHYEAQVCCHELSDPNEYPLPTCNDPDDQKFLILAAACQADYLVTRDRQLLRLAKSKRWALSFKIVPPDFFE